MVRPHAVAQIAVALYRPCVRLVGIVMLSHMMSEGGCSETQDVIRWLW